MNTSARNLISPNLASSNSHGLHNTTLRSPNLASAKINKLGHLFLFAKPAYASVVQPHVGLILADHDSLAHIPRIHAVFLCVLSAYARFMVRLKGDTFACASDLESLSANPFQSYHLNHLAVIGKTSIYSLGVTPMTNTAQNPSKSAANTSFVSLHNPTDPATESYTFDTLEAAHVFKQQHCLSAYRIAHVELFAVESGSVFA